MSAVCLHSQYKVRIWTLRLKMNNSTFTILARKFKWDILVILYFSKLTRHFSSSISGSDNLLPQIINVSSSGWYDGICAPGWDKGNTKNHGCMHAMDTQELLLSKNNQSCCTQTKNKMAMVISSQGILFGYIW